MNWLKLKELVLRPHGRISFLYSLNREDLRILDVGCGNDSSFQIRKHFPKCYYTGVDIGDYNMTKPHKANEYHICRPDQFSECISNLGKRFDAVISAHNIEHCNDRLGTLAAIKSVVVDEGSVFMSFPTETSVGFPSRLGTLNYFDDNTHLESPPKFSEITANLEDGGFSIVFYTKKSRPFILFLVGLFNEIWSSFSNRVMRGTWQLYGFESIIWARKNN